MPNLTPFTLEFQRRPVWTTTRSKTVVPARDVAAAVAFLRGHLGDDDPARAPRYVIFHKEQEVPGPEVFTASSAPVSQTVP